MTDSHGSADRRNRPEYGSRTSMGFRHRVESRGLAAFGGIVLAVGLFHAVTGDGAGAIPYVLLATFVAVPVLYRSVSQRLVLSPDFVEVHRLTGVRRWPLDGSCSLTWVDARSARRGTDRRFAHLRLVNKSGHALKLSGTEWVDSQIWAQRLMEEVRQGAVGGTGDAAEALRSYAAGVRAEVRADAAARSRAEQMATTQPGPSSMWGLPARHRSGRLVGSAQSGPGQPWTLGGALGLVLAGLVIALGLTGVAVAEASVSHSTTTWAAAGAFTMVPLAILWLGIHLLRWSRYWARRGGAR